MPLLVRVWMRLLRVVWEVVRVALLLWVAVLLLVVVVQPWGALGCSDHFHMMLPLLFIKPVLETGSGKTHQGPADCERRFRDPAKSSVRVTTR